MKITIESSTGQYAITATVKFNQDLPTDSKAAKVLKGGVLSEGLYRGCFPDCRLVIAGVPLKDAKGNRSKMPKGEDGKTVDVNKIAYKPEVGEKIREIVHSKLAEVCDGLEGVHVTKYEVQTDEDAGLKAIMKVLELQQRAGVIGKDVDIREMALTLKASK
jgi:hypothetical protein